MAKKKENQDATHRIFEVDGRVETVEKLKNWCSIDGTYGQVSMVEQLKSAAKAHKPTREYAATVMLGMVAELR